MEKSFSNKKLFGKLIRDSKYNSGQWQYFTLLSLKCVNCKNGVLRRLVRSQISYYDQDNLIFWPNLACPSTLFKVFPLGDLKPPAPFDDPLRKRHAGNSRLHAFACLFFFQLEIKQIWLGKRRPKKYVYLFQRQLLSNTSESQRIYITGSQSAQLARVFASLLYKCLLTHATHAALVFITR